MPFWNIKDAGREDETEKIFESFGFKVEKNQQQSSKNLPGWRRIFVDRYIPEELKTALKEAGIYFA